MRRRRAGGSPYSGVLRLSESPSPHPAPSPPSGSGCVTRTPKLHNSAGHGLLCILVLSLSAVAGCTLKKQAPVKLAFVLEAQRSPNARPASNPVTLRVRPLTVAPPFEGRSFVYRNSDLNYESD